MASPRQPFRMRRSGAGVAGSGGDGGGGGGGGFVVDTPLIIRLAVLVIALWALSLFVLPLPDHETHLVRRRSVSLRLHPNKERISTSSRWVQSTEGRDASGNRMDPMTIRYTPARFPLAAPTATWPVPHIDLRDGYQYESIIHPGAYGGGDDTEPRMRVPRFWSRPLHNNTLLSRELATSIGTCTTPDGTSINRSHARGSACPPDERTIFVALASYRDYQCRDTLESIFIRARHPERIRVALVDQRDLEADLSCVFPRIPCIRDPDQALCKFADQIELYDMDRHLAIGPSFARHIANRFYRGEYYAMQMDAQTTFVRDWDVDVINQHESTGNEMAVLSHTPQDIINSIDPKTGRALETKRTIMCETHYLKENYLENDIWNLKDEVSPERPILQPFWSAAFSFARGHFAVNVPYDQYTTFLFSEEEISMALRGFSVGYDFYSPARNICFHTYANGENEKDRKKVPLFWENEKRYGEDVGHFRARIKAMIGLSPEQNVHAWNHVGKELYGLGGARQVSKFFSVYGIDPMEKIHEHHLCDFVDDGTMHEKFVKHLRSNGMGIDYESIQYQFKDSRPVEASQRNGNRKKNKLVGVEEQQGKQEEASSAVEDEGEGRNQHEDDEAGEDKQGQQEDNDSQEE